MQIGKTEDLIQIDINPALLMIIFIVWTMFIYTIGSAFYKCECELVNLKNTVSYSQCHEFYDDDLYYELIDMYATGNYSSLDELITYSNNKTPKTVETQDSIPPYQNAEPYTAFEVY